MVSHCWVEGAQNDAGMYQELKTCSDSEPTKQPMEPEDSCAPWHSVPVSQLFQEHWAGWPGAVRTVPGGQMVSSPPQRPVGGRPHESLWPLTTQELRQPDEMGSCPRKYFVDSEGQRWGPE